MGEVYRADDLKLGQPVALKFIPEEFSRDSSRLERFFNEVRTARQVTHVNVCRVHDLGEVDGHHFLSMEYVDGEDLGTLLRRIGRVPRDKAVEIARQLCAGLAAAHKEGILHRDLKPANVMLDGRGRARITDFGLAGLAESIEGGEIRVGTPAYQAPEQLAGKEVSTASDIYALGLVLYEIFTGKRAFEATSVAELAEMQKSGTPPSLSSHVEGLGDSIERIIQRCLDQDPSKRPESALAVAMALPGGDPLAAAMAAGETPSPGMVADAGEEGALAPWVAIALLGVILAGVTLDFVFRSRVSTLARIGLPKSAAELRIEARKILEEIGHDAPAYDTAWGLTSSTNFYDWVERTDQSPERWDILETVAPRPYYLWFRQSPEWFRVGGFQLATWEEYPPSTKPGTADVHLDAEGRLLSLRIIPSIVSSETKIDPEFSWEPIIERSGIDLDSLEPVEPVANPPFNCEAQSAWQGVYPGQAEIPVRIEACRTGGKVTFLEVMPPWSERVIALGEGEVSSRREERRERIETVAVPILLVVFFAILSGGLLLARRNLNLRRADRRGAARLAALLFGLELAVNLVETHYGPLEQTFRLLLQSLAQAVYIGALGWVLYVASEPFIRRVWPQSVISFQRLLSGRFADPLIGRDILIGAAFAVTALLARTGFFFTGEGSELVTGGDLIFLSGVKRWTAQMFGLVPIFPPLIVMTLIVLLRILLRRDWLVVLVPTALMVILLTGVGGDPVDAIWFALIWAPVFFLPVRFGFLALTAAAWMSSIADLVRVWDPSSWYFPYVLAGLLFFLLPFLYAFVISMGRRKLIRAELLDG
jgi:serine/threonine-protein kinase